MESQMVRVAFARQPARIVLVDFSPPFSEEICHHLHQALEHTLALVCSMTGACRVPFFGLSALGTHSENLFPLQHVRGNFPRLQSALHELKSFHHIGRIPDHSTHSLPHALEDALAQFKRQSQTLRQTTNFNSQLQVIIITCQQGKVVSKQLEKSLGDLDLESLRKIQVLSVFNPDGEMLGEEDMTCSSQQSSSTASSPSSAENLLHCGVLDVISIEPGELSFQTFFTGWFHDCGTDREQLHLLFPNEGMPTGKLVLKCDLQERFISPAVLPFQAQFQLTGESPLHSKPPTQASQATSGQPTPVRKLRVMQMVRIQGVCDSVVFGKPVIARPTACWKLDWEELDSNQQNFHSLCHLLSEREMALITRLEPAELTTHPYASSSSSTSSSSSHTFPKPRGHFVVLPSPSLSLLIKPLATNELMLPGDFQAQEERPISDSLAIVEEYLNKLDVLDAYNPLLTRSNLTSSLVSLLTKNSAATRNPRRGRGTRHPANVPSAVQPAFSHTAAVGRGRSRGRGRGHSRTHPPAHPPPAPVPRPFQTASDLMAGGTKPKRFCALPMGTDVYDFEY